MPIAGGGTEPASSSQASPVVTIARNLLILAVVGALAAWALSYRSEVSQAFREALPDAVPQNAASEASPPVAAATDSPYEASNDFSREIVIRKDRSGHFLVEAVVNGVPIRFLVDTGASDVVLSPQDGRRLRLNASTLSYDLAYQTANGMVRAAPVTLRDVRIGQLELYEVEASVNEADMGISLLGMSFLERLDGYAVEGDRLILRW